MKKILLILACIIIGAGISLFAQPIPYPVIPGGLTTQVQFNNAGVFAGSHFYFDSANDKGYFQPTVDSTTAFQILDADGGTPIFNVDSTNERVGIGTASPLATFDVVSSASLVGSFERIVSGHSGIYVALDFVSRADSDSISDGFGAGFRFNLRNSSGTLFNLGLISARRNGADNSGALTFSVYTAGVLGEKARITTNGFFGIGPETAPETLLELTHATPYITLHNNTHEDTAGGRESRLNFKGEQSGGEETTLARIEVSHDGSSDDQKGQEKGFINDGDDGDSPTQVYEWDSTGLEFVNTAIIYDVNNISADITNFNTYGIHIINSSSAGITGVLADGTKVGQSVKFVCKVAGNDIDISVSHHITSDPEVIRLDTAKEWVGLVWDGTDWVEVDGNGQSYP